MANINVESTKLKSNLKITGAPSSLEVRITCSIVSLLLALAAFVLYKCYTWVMRDPRQRPYKKDKRKARTRPPPRPTATKKKTRAKPAAVHGKARRSPAVRSKNKARTSNDYRTAPADETKRSKQRWMAGMQRVHAEARVQFRQRRQELDARHLERSLPKTKKKVPTACSSRRDAPALAPPPTGGKAGRSQYLIQVGAEDHLHRTYKPSARRGGARAPTRAPEEVDLHGMTRAEALVALEARLPRWVETAMTGAAPWVVTVRIVCGGGNQILSEAVAHWIREKRQVSKAPAERRQ